LFRRYSSAWHRQDHVCNRCRTRTLYVDGPRWQRHACVLARALHDCVVALFPGVLELSLVLRLIGWCRYAWQRARSN
jgi:hypothetical protein